MLDDDFKLQLIRVLGGGLGDDKKPPALPPPAAPPDNPGGVEEKHVTGQMQCVLMGRASDGTLKALPIDRLTGGLLIASAPEPAAARGFDQINIDAAEVVGVHNTTAYSATLTLGTPLDLAAYSKVVIASVPPVWSATYAAQGATNYIGTQELQGKINGSWVTLNGTQNSGVLTDLRVKVALDNASDDLTTDYSFTVILIVGGAGSAEDV